MESQFVKQILNAVSQYENKVAIVDQDGTRKTTYGEMLTLARKFGAYIQQKNIAPQSFVCIQMPNDMEFMAAELGVWLSNCAAVPMGINYPIERVRSIMQHCESPLLLNADSFSDLPETLAEPVIPAITDNAFLLYTSGSTGNPKGVLHTFETLDVNVPRPIIDELDGNLLIRDEVIYATTAPLYFTACMPLWDVLTGGGTIHLFSDRVKKDVELLAGYIKQHEINICNIAPAALSVFKNTSDKLKVVTAAGEKLTTQHSKEGYILYNWIGQTETINGFARYRMPNHQLEKVPIGKTYWGVEFRVVDDEGNDLPQGQLGELLIKGHFFKEYYKEPELTAQAYDNGWLPHTTSSAMPPRRRRSTKPCSRSNARSALTMSSATS